MQRWTAWNTRALGASVVGVMMATTGCSSLSGVGVEGADGGLGSDSATIVSYADDATPPLADAYRAPTDSGIFVCPAETVSYSASESCVLDGSGTIDCPGAPIVRGWVYSCAEPSLDGGGIGAGAMPSGVGNCRLSGEHDDFGHHYLTVNCDTPSCSRASQFDDRCLGLLGYLNAYGCPAPEAMTGVGEMNGCQRAGSWGDGVSSGPLMCCP